MTTQNDIKLDDISFQQKLWQSPNALDESMQAYLEANPEMIESVKQAKQFEESLSDVLDVPAPEGLHARILMKNTFEEASKIAARSKRTQTMGLSWEAFPKLTAIAASFLVLAVGVSFYQHHEATQQTVQLAKNDPMEMEDAILKHIVEHAKEQPEIMTAQNLQPNPKELQRIFKYVGATMHKPIDFMSYAGDCEVDGQKGLHIVLQEIEGPVTIIVLPHRKLNGMFTFAQDGMKGQIIPVKGAVVAIVGTNDKQLAMAQMHFFNAVSFGRGAIS